MYVIVASSKLLFGLMLGQAGGNLTICMQEMAATTDCI
jgi:hypothetical protein